MIDFRDSRNKKKKRKKCTRKAFKVAKANLNTKLPWGNEKKREEKKIFNTKMDNTKWEYSNLKPIHHDNATQCCLCRTVDYNWVNLHNWMSKYITHLILLTHSFILSLYFSRFIAFSIIASHRHIYAYNNTRILLSSWYISDNVI